MECMGRIMSSNISSNRFSPKIAGNISHSSIPYNTARSCVGEKFSRGGELLSPCFLCAGKPGTGPAHTLQYRTGKNGCQQDGTMLQKPGAIRPFCKNLTRVLHFRNSLGVFP